MDKIDCTTCKYGYEDERLGIPMCHHPKRFSEDCVDFNMHEEKHLDDKSDKSLEEEITRWLNEGDITDTRFDDYDDSDIERTARHFAEWQASQMPMPEDTVLFNKGVQEGRRLEREDMTKDAEKDLGWHSVDESLPPIDEEVIVLTDVVNNDYPENKIDGANFMCFGHIVDPDAIVDVYGNPYKVVEYNGWNIPGVKYWMPMPKLPKEEEK